MASSPTGKAAIDEIKQNITAGGEHLTIHSPVAICPLAAFGYSIWALMAMTQTRLTGDMNAVIGHKHEFCFETYVILENGIEKTVSIEQVKRGDIFVVRPGEISRWKRSGRGQQRSQ